MQAIERTQTENVAVTLSEVLSKLLDNKKVRIVRPNLLFGETLRKKIESIGYELTMRKCNNCMEFFLNEIKN